MAVDQVAERVGAPGVRTPGSCCEVGQLSSVPQETDQPDAMLAEAAVVHTPQPLHRSSPDLPRCPGHGGAGAGMERFDMYQKIVVGTDGSERAQQAVDQAAALADLTGASLALVVGCGSPLAGAWAAGGGVPFDAIDMTEGASEMMEGVAAPLRERGLEVTTHVYPASGNSAVVQAANDLDADLIVVGNRGMSGAARFLGSVPNAVTHQAPCSVLIVATQS